MLIQKVFSHLFILDNADCFGSSTDYVLVDMLQVGLVFKVLMLQIKSLVICMNTSDKVTDLTQKLLYHLGNFVLSSNAL